MTDKGPTHESFPRAEVVRASAVRRIARRGRTHFWWVTGLCLIVSIVLFVSQGALEGPRIVVSFDEGHGLSAGDAVRYRGVQIGEVEAVEVKPSLDGIDVKLLLRPDARPLAREGAVFWIERPEISLSGARGLDTVVGGKYIGVVPGPSGSAPSDRFLGSERALDLTVPDAREITITFREGNGLAVGDRVLFRGIQVGEVTRLVLEQRLDGLIATVRLAGSGTALARPGSSFWIERPRVSLSGVSGLDTIVGGRHIAVRPGPRSGERQDQFEGLSESPIERPTGGLEIELYSAAESSVGKGAPVTYRGFRVGHVISVGLSSDGVEVESRVYILPEYRSLVRRNSTFWVKSGVDFSVGFTGVSFDTDSLQSLATGGIAFATPDPAGEEAITGARFGTLDEAPDGWENWKPHLAIGTSLLPPGIPLPNPHRATLRWRTSTLGFKSAYDRKGWLLGLEDGSIFGPRDLLSPADDTVDGTRLEVSGFSTRLPDQWANATSSGISVRRIKPLKPAWPRDRMRHPEGPEDCVLIADPRGAPVPLSSDRIRSNDDSTWTAEAPIPATDDWHGAVVVSRSDGAIIAIVLIADGEWVIRPIPSGLLR